VLKNFYQQELANLRELGLEFSRGNPALAPMLGARGDDPDVERLLEGVAFLSSLVRRQLSEGYPELIQALLWLVCPKVLLPTPSHTMMLFKPVQGFTEAIKLPRGAELASVEVDGASAIFSTSADLMILPAAITQVSIDQRGGDQAAVTLTVSSNAPLSRWLPDSLSIHLAGDYPEASDRRNQILSHTKVVEVETAGRTLSLNRSNLAPGGFDFALSRIQDSSFWAFDLIREYFTMPEQFLFLNLTGLGPLRATGDHGFTITFRLGDLSIPLPNLRPNHFLLNVCPAVNVFLHQAQPLVVDHKSNEYLLQPQDFKTEKLDIYGIGDVKSITSDGQSRPYIPYKFISSTDPDVGLYSITRRQSPVSEKLLHYITLLYRAGDKLPTRETLSTSLYCYNLEITDYLRTGEITQPTDSSPSMATFLNIIPPTKFSPAVIAESQLLKLLSHLHINLMPNLTAKLLQEILSLHAVPGDADLGRRQSNQKRIEAVGSLESHLEDLFIRGLPIRGSRLDLNVDPAGFASRGDVKLFGDVLDNFFGLFHHINSYSRLTITENNSPEVMSWPPRLGLKRLL
jgi:type VI secretion system protein ImpG